MADKNVSKPLKLCSRIWRVNRIGNGLQWNRVLILATFLLSVHRGETANRISSPSVHVKIHGDQGPVQVGKKAEIVCFIDDALPGSHPLVSFWEKDSNLLQENDYYRYSHRVGPAVLNIASVRKNNEGTFTCVTEPLMNGTRLTGSAVLSIEGEQSAPNNVSNTTVTHIQQNVTPAQENITPTQQNITLTQQTVKVATPSKIEPSKPLLTESPSSTGFITEREATTNNSTSTGTLTIGLSACLPFALLLVLVVIFAKCRSKKSRKRTFQLEDPANDISMQPERAQLSNYQENVHTESRNQDVTECVSQSLAEAIDRLPNQGRLSFNDTDDHYLINRTSEPSGQCSMPVEDPNQGVRNSHLSSVTTDAVVTEASKRPSRTQLWQLSVMIASNWESVAACLFVSDYYRVDNMKRNFHSEGTRDCRQQAITMLNEWQNSRGSDGTVGQLYEALVETGSREYAEAVLGVLEK